MLRTFAGHNVAANLLMVLIVLGGLTTLGGIPREIFPTLRPDLLSVTIAYPGAGPAEVERSICLRFEDALRDLDEMRRLECRAEEGIALLRIELQDGADRLRALEGVRERVGAIEELPDDAEEPIVREAEGMQQVLSLVVSGDLPAGDLKRLAERLRDELRRQVDAGRVVLAATRRDEISIEVSERMLRRHGITFDELAAALRRASVDLAGGSLDTEAGAFLLRADGKALEREDFERLIVRTKVDGRRLELGALATVRDGLAEDGPTARFDGHPAALIQVYRGSGQSVVQLADAVREFVERQRPDLPPNVELTVWQDDSRLLAGRLEALLANSRSGFLLVLMVLALFLRLRLGAWVAVGIPVSFLGALWWMPFFDISINQVSVIAFLLVLGIVVDDAIVVGENIYRYQQTGMDPRDAAVRGVDEVAVPVLLSVLTTIAAFLPLAAMPGNVGKVMRVIPIVVVLTLFFSLLESLLVLPAHLASLPQRNRGETDDQRPGARFRRMQDRFAGLLDSAATRWFRPVLEQALHHRLVTVAVAVALFITTLGLLSGGHVGVAFFPRIAGDNAVALLTLSHGAGEAATRRAADAIEASLGRLRGALDGPRDPALGPSDPNAPRDIVRHVLVTVGEQPWTTKVLMQTTGIANQRVAGEHLAEVHVELTPAAERTLEPDELIERWREHLEPLPQVRELVFDTTLFAVARDREIELAADRPEVLAAGVARLRAALAATPSVSDISDSLIAGKPEIHLEVTPAAEAAGLRLADLARQVRQSFYGEEVQRLQRSTEELKVMLRYPPSERRSLADLEQMRVRTPDGGELAFDAAARTRVEPGIGAITRIDGRRIARVTANVDPRLASPREIVAWLRQDVLPELARDLPQLDVRFEGQQAEQETSGRGLLRAFVLSLFSIYALLAIAFRSYLQPLVVLLAVPFGLVGAVWGHLLLGLDLTIFSAFGVVALTGVVVNDSLVLVSFVNRRRAAGAPLLSALRNAGVDRFRPIVLTTLTTFAGLAPLLFAHDLQARFLVPLATSIAFGVAFSTLVVLILVPVALSLLDSLVRKTRRFDLALRSPHETG
ncbi:MAG: efflux RND transporter permease subunit [Acidobacteriota bacterium]